MKTGREASCCECKIKKKGQKKKGQIFQKFMFEFLRAGFSTNTDVLFSFSLAAQRSLQQQADGHPSQSLRPTRGFAPTVSSVCTSRQEFEVRGAAGFLDSCRRAVANMATNSDAFFSELLYFWSLGWILAESCCVCGFIPVRKHTLC